MEIDKDRLAILAADCQTKHTAMQDLHRELQKGKSPEIAGKLAIAQVEYNRARNLLDLEIRNQSTTIVIKGD